MYQRKVVGLSPETKIYPGVELPSEIEELHVIQPHVHIFDSHVGGVVIGSSIWWVVNKDNSISKYTKIKGLICNCGSILMLDE